MEHQELKKERHQLKQLSKTDTVRTARQEDKRTGEIRNIAYIVLLDELWYFSCPSCPTIRELKKKGYIPVKKLVNRWIFGFLDFWGFDQNFTCW